MNCIFWSQMSTRPGITRPMACYVLARWLEQNDYTCQVVEFVHLFLAEELAEYTEQFITEDTLYIGVSTSMWSTANEEMKRRSVSTTIPKNVEGAMDILKSKYPNIKFVAGGATTHTFSEDLKKFDVIIDDQYAEDSLLKFTDNLAQRQLGYKFKFRKPFDFDTFKFSWQQHDCLLPNESVPIETSRGCIFKCSFCRDPLLGKKPGTLERSYDALREEFIRNYEEFGITRYTIITETFNDDPGRIFMMERLAKSLPFKLEWISWFRLDLIAKNPETIEAIANSGCVGAFFGIETFHPEAAKAVKKSYQAKIAKEWITKLVEAWKDRVLIQTSFIVGLPYEPEESIKEGIEWISNSGVHAFVIYALTLGKSTGISMFEDRPDLYGFKFGLYKPDGTPDLKYLYQWWKHDIMDYERAKQLTGELNRKYFARNNYSIFSLPGKGWNQGKTTAEFTKLRNKILTDADSMTDQWATEEHSFNEYKKMLMALDRNK